MLLVLLDRANVTTTSTGTGTITLGSAVSGYQDFSGVGDGNKTFYTITDGTNWETGIGTYTATGTTLSRSWIFESSNNNSLVDFSAGTKYVFIPHASVNTQGTTPTIDDSSINENLESWKNFQKTLLKSINSGSSFKNSNRQGIPSTYSLLYTTASEAYYGAVLASNGDIHFVPYNAGRGQKVSAAGVVSTYTLVYAVAAAYIGGILAPNGDIHFIPRSANRGQKISASGVVSTYSLVYTNSSGAYTGGVLAPNGDIHFVPRSAVVGQKVSTSGVVSTYSLAYTTATAYFGGVLAPNGDIHFVPAIATVGQKISITGVVSTYSLAYVNIGGTAQFFGGVLAPNGDIHFVPYNSPVGQKVSVDGIVSTYSLLYTTTISQSGGILMPTGEIYFVPASAVRGQKIATCPGISLKLESCLSSFLNKS